MVLLTTTVLPSLCGELLYNGLKKQKKGTPSEPAHKLKSTLEIIQSHHQPLHTYLPDSPGQQPEEDNKLTDTPTVFTKIKEAQICLGRH